MSNMTKITRKAKRRAYLLINKSYKIVRGHTSLYPPDFLLWLKGCYG